MARNNTVDGFDIVKLCSSGMLKRRSVYFFGGGKQDNFVFFITPLSASPPEKQ